MRTEPTIHAAAGVHRSLETQRAEYPLLLPGKIDGRPITARLFCGRSPAFGYSRY